MTEHTDRLGDLGTEEFEIERRGYSRRQVDEFAARARNQARESRDLENRLSHALDENERIRLELSAARQAPGSRPPHEEISERVGQILKLADDEAKSQRDRASEEIQKLRADAKADTDRQRAEAKAETDKFRAEAQSQAERMLRAAQEQAENSVAGARSEAEKTRNAARTEAERSVADAHKQAETAVASAKAQAKQVLDEATARATAIHDGAERRLNLLMSRHTEAIRRLTEIRDVVTTLVAGEVARGSLEDEVEKAVATALGDKTPAAPTAAARPAGPADGRHAPAGPAPAHGAAPGPAHATPVGPGGSAGQGAGHGGPLAPSGAPAQGVGPAQGSAPAQGMPTVSPQPQQAAARGRVTEPGPRTQPVPVKPAGATDAPAGNGPAVSDAENQARPTTAPRIPNGQHAQGEGAARPSGTSEGARHAAGRSGSPEDTADNVRIVPE